MKYRIIAALSAILFSGSLLAATATPRVVGGDLADTNWNTLAALIHKPTKQQAADDELTFPVAIGQVCGGTVLSPHWVLTAAHCVRFGTATTPASELELLIGSQTLDVPVDSSLLLDAESVFVHPGYNENTFENDIALIRLSEPAAVGSAAIQSGVLATSDTDSDMEALVSYDDFLNVLGWGIATYEDQDENPDTLEPVAYVELLEVALDYVTNTSCQSTVDLYTDGDQILDSMVCANEPFPDGEPDGDPFGEDTCQGDSGGPLLLTSATLNDSPQVGITSFGYSPDGKCGAEEVPSVYTRVSHFLDWIEITTSISDIELRNLAIGEDQGQNQGINSFPVSIPVDNAGTLGATRFRLNISHSKGLSFTANEPGLTCMSSTGKTECEYTGDPITGSNTKAINLTATDNSSRSSGTEVLGVTVTLTDHRDYHRLDDSGTVTLYFGEPVLDITAEPICLTPGNNNSQMRVEVSLANSSTQIDSLGTTVSTTLPEALSLIGKVSPACEIDNADVLCTLGEIEMESEAAAVIGVKAPADTEVLTVSLAADNDNGLAVGSNPTVDVELDFGREDLEACPAIPSSSSSAALVSSGGGGGAFHLLALLTLALAGLRRRA